MNRKELVARAADFLRDNGVKKPVYIKKHTFKISDTDGNAANFHVKRQDKEVMFTVEDVGAITDALVSVIVDSIRHGEEISLRGFGTLGVQLRKARCTKKPGTDEWVDVPARYIPKFSFGNDLRRAARLYELDLMGADTDAYETSLEDMLVEGDDD